MSASAEARSPAATNSAPSSMRSEILLVVRRKALARRRMASPWNRSCSCRNSGPSRRICRSPTIPRTRSSASEERVLLAEGGLQRAHGPEVDDGHPAPPQQQDVLRVPVPVEVALLEDLAVQRKVDAPAHPHGVDVVPLQPRGERLRRLVLRADE